MNRWQAITEIVKSFNERGHHPAYALAALGLVLAILLAAVALIYVLGAPAVSPVAKAIAAAV